ncbi:hypothetical protein M8818_004135 [Zalaria obscura]|uniref:Uncharacterized protein n=1 Tax=Zalaria obscura TaxID=2024903 RepID=A0ACC3SCT5_9PEZI
MNANPRGRAELKQAARGVKREADDSLDDDQRFAKRFDLLNIGMSPVCGRHEQLVLYTVPKSLSVPEERDSVRKAIIEARHRAMKKAAGRSGAAADTAESHEDSAETAHGFDATDYIMDDPDAMDIG